MQAEKAVRLAADSGVSPEDLLRFRRAPGDQEDDTNSLTPHISKQQILTEDMAKKHRLSSVSEEGSSSEAEAQDPDSWRKKENNAHK